MVLFLTHCHTAVDDWFGDVRPLDAEHLRRLRVNCPHLVDVVNVRDGLLDEMMSTGCLTPQQTDAIKELSSSSAEKTRRLLDILTRRSVEHYNKFLACLRRNAQSFIADVLENGGGQISNDIKLCLTTNLTIARKVD